MTRPAEHLTKIVHEIEQAAYKRGWADAVAAVNAAVSKMHSVPAIVVTTAKAEPKKRPTPRYRRQANRPAKPDGTALETVLTAITNHPGQTGTQVAQLVADRVNKHTVRTHLRRLKMKQEIVQDENLRWFKKQKEAA